MNNTLSTFIHLNGSFSDQLGLWDGKAAVALYFSSLNDEYHKYEIAFNFLQETLSQISTHSPTGYGNGMAGIAALVEHLAHQNIVDQNPQDILIDMEAHIIKVIRSAFTQDISLYNGYAGYGMYLVKRYSSKYTVEECRRITYYELFDIILNNIADLIPSIPLENNKFSIWNGIPGVSLFLNESKKFFVNEQISKIEAHISNQYYNYLMTQEFDWHKIHVLFVMSYCHLFPDDSRIDSLKLMINIFIKMAIENIDNLDIYSATFVNFLLKRMIRENIDININHLSIKISSYISDINKNHTINQIFPYKITERGVDLGLNQGVCGHALFTLEENFISGNWSSLIGI